jgi:antitoxin (DNA-binding transcriptional repressor) of toxin-antitoxin stability system
MLEAKSQLSRLVKAALEGEEVIIASHSKAQVKLVPCSSSSGLTHPGSMVGVTSSQMAAAFSEDVDEQVVRLFRS